MTPSGLGGYLLLILLAILAPTPIPIPLDGIVIALIKIGFRPVFVITVTIIGDLIGTFLIFKIGDKSRNIFNKYLEKKDRKDYIIAERLFKKFGKFSLFLSGVPFLGDALIFISGFYKLPLRDFFQFFLLGKLIWYILLFLGVTRFR
ncbi:hypothetical protein BH10PAT1_BH10PAT1_0730 [soil metagenome]